MVQSVRIQHKVPGIASTYWYSIVPTETSCTNAACWRNVYYAFFDCELHAKNLDIKQAFRVTFRVLPTWKVCLSRLLPRQQALYCGEEVTGPAVGGHTQYTLGAKTHGDTCNFLVV